MDLNRQWRVAPVICFLLALSCARVAPEKKPLRLRLATTTSTENSGLLNEILPPFERMFNVRVDVLAVGTGKALRLGQNGDADVILVHAREAEEAFVAAGHGVNRRRLMYNDFIIVGPEGDPAEIKKLEDPVEALQAIAKNKNTFVSRGDDSGTHKKEKSLWQQSGLAPSGKWFIESGQGMGPTLQIADEKQGYCFTDRGTYLAYKEKHGLVVLFQGDERLINTYGVIAVSPAKHTDVSYVYAMALIGWLTSPTCQKMIGEYERSGRALFIPNAY